VVLAKVGVLSILIMQEKGIIVILPISTVSKGVPPVKLPIRLI